MRVVRQTEKGTDGVRPREANATERATEAAAGAVPHRGDVEGGIGWRNPERQRRDDRSAGHVSRGT